MSWYERPAQMRMGAALQGDEIRRGYMAHTNLVFQELFAQICRELAREEALSCELLFGRSDFARAVL